MEYDLILLWRPGPQHRLPDALSRLPIADAPGADVDDSFPDDSSTWTTYRGPQGPVLDGILVSELGVEEVNTPTGRNPGVMASLVFTPGGAGGGACKTREAADAEEPEALRAEVTVVVEEAPGELEAPLEGLCALFGDDQAHPQVTPAVTQPKAGTRSLRATEQRPPVTATGPAAFEAPGLRQSPPSSPSPPRRETSSPTVGPTPRPGKQAASAEHPGPLAPMISRVAETPRNPPSIAQHQREDARLGPVGGRLPGDGDRQTLEETAEYILDDNDLLGNAPPGGGRS